MSVRWPVSTSLVFLSVILQPLQKFQKRLPLTEHLTTRCQAKCMADQSAGARLAEDTRAESRNARDTAAATKAELNFGDSDARAGACQDYSCVWV